jgi:hypothetical protein
MALKTNLEVPSPVMATVDGKGRHGSTVKQPNPRHFVLLNAMRGWAPLKSLRVV